MKPLDSSFLGRGWTFPPSFNSNLGKVTMVSGEQDIKESLHILLSTRLGERIMLPQYGCNLEDQVFNAINNTTKTIIRDQVETAIIYHEPRIDVEGVKIDGSSLPEGFLTISIHYKIRATNSRTNVVFPFYINEGNNL